MTFFHNSFSSKHLNTMVNVTDLAYSKMNFYLKYVLLKNQVFKNGLQGWCSMYECTDFNWVYFTSLVIGALIIFSPWTAIDGIIGGFLAQFAGNFYLYSLLHHFIK